MADVEATRCIVEGCERVAALSDVTRGDFWTYRADYCSTCFEEMVSGRLLKIEASRLVLMPSQQDEACPSWRLTQMREEYGQGLSGRP